METCIVFLSLRKSQEILTFLISYSLYVENIGASHLNYIWLSKKNLGHNFIPWKLCRILTALFFSMPTTLIFLYTYICGSDSKASAYNVGDPGSIPGSGRSPGEGNGNPLHYSCLENPFDGEAW